MKDVFKINKFYILIFAISVISLFVALYIEFVLGHKPCTLCIYQRVPYLIAIFITFFGISYYNNLLWLYCLLITFVSSILISGYHFGIEQDVFKEFSGCTTNNMDLIDKDKLLKLLQSEIKSCKNVEFKIFGFSLAAINLFLSTVIFILTAKVLLNEKNRQKQN
tara:strand:+ start:33 stop:524 length:492 start_codon:yes stop_codon:yes gene_type:complete